MENLITTTQAAQILGVSTSTLRNWRERKLFGCPFFSADVKRGNVWYYERERVEQLKSVYQKGVLSNMYKLADDTPADYFQIGDSNLRHPASDDTPADYFQIGDSNLRHPASDDTPADYFQIGDSNLGNPASPPVGWYNRGYMTIAQVAERFNVTERTVRNWVEDGTLRWDRYDHANRWLFKKETIKDFTPPSKRNSITSKGEKKMEISQETIDKINQIPPEILFSHGVIKKARFDYVCPMCENGTGKDGTGIKPLISNSHVGWHCHKCGESFNNIAILANHYGLNSRSDFQLLIEKICADFDVSLDYNCELMRKKSAVPPAELNFINSDLHCDLQPLKDFLAAQGGLWRGLPLEMLERFGCRYINAWTHPKARKAGSLATPSPRIIIPANVDGLHSNYLARLTCNLSDFDAKAKKYIAEKQHAGKKTLFNPDALSADIVFVFEGYIDAISATYAGAKAVALGGADDYSLLVDAISTLEKKPRIIILFDSDATGKKLAPQLKKALDKIGCQSCIRFLSPEADSKIDANQILQEESVDYLTRELFALRQDALKDFDKNSADKLQSAGLQKSNTDAELFGISDSTSQKAKRQERADRMKNLMTTREVADFLGVSLSTVKHWRTRKLFGCYFFLADEKHGDTLYYERERVEQLKAVYQKGILQNMYKLAKLNPDPMPPDYFQNSDPSGDISDFQNSDPSGDTNNFGEELSFRHAGFFTADEVADIFGVDVRTVERWVKRGILSEDMLGHNGDLYFGIDNILDFSPPREKKTLEEKDFADSLKFSPAQKQFLYSGDLSDVGFSDRIDFIYHDSIRYLQDENSWLILQRNNFGGGVWKNRGEKKSVIEPFVRQLSKALEDNAEDSKQAKFGKHLRKQKNISQAIEALKGIQSLIIHPEDLNKPKHLLNVLNGVVDLKTGTLLPLDPDYLIMNQAGAVYDPEADTAFVDKFLADILPDENTRRAVLRYLGYCLTGMKNYHTSEFWRGNTGANGKSTLIDFVMKVFGSYAKKLPAAGLLENRRPIDANSATPAISQLDGDIRLAIIDELPRNTRLDAALFKTLTGDETVYSRALYCSPRIIELRAKFIINGNHLPTFDVDDGGLERRITNIPFNQKFTGSRADSELSQKLSTPENLSALLKILVNEAKAFYLDGLLESEEMKAAKAEYFAENDFVRTFLIDNCITNHGGEISRKSLEERLLAEYPRECGRMKKKDLFEQILARLEPHGVIYKMIHGKNVFKNIKWLDSQN